MSSKEESPTKQRTPAPSTAETSAPLAISSSSQANSNGASSSTNGFAPVVSTLEYSGIAYGSNDYSVANATSTSSSQKILVESEFLFGHNVKKMVKISGPSITVERIISSVVESCQLTQSPEQLLFTFHDPEVEEFVVLDEFSLADFLQLPKKIIHLQSVAPLIPGGASPEKKESTTPSRLASKSDEQETTSASTDVTVSPPINKADKPLVARAHVLQLITFLGVHSNLSHRETRDMLLSAGTYGFVNFLVRLSLSQSRANDAAGDSSSCINATASRWKITAEFPPIGSRVLSLNGVFVNDLERNQQITLLKQRRRPFVIEFEVFDPPITDTHRPNPPTIKFALFYSKYTSSYASKLRKQIDKILEDYETCDWADAKRQGTEEWYQAIRGLHQLSMLETPGEMTQRLKLVVDLITRALEKYINRPPSLLLDPQSTMAHAQQAREQDLLTCSACKQVHLANGDNETISIPEPLSASTVRQWNDTYGYVNAAVWCPGSDEAAAQPKHITGDDLLPGLVFALIQANPPNIDCLLWLCAEFRHPSLHVGEEAYCLATVSSALEFVRRARYQSVDVIPHILYDHFMLRYTYTLKLMLACKDGDLRQVQRLVENGADVNGLSPDQLDSPLTACVRYNQPRILYYLLFEQHTTVVHVDAVVHLYRGPHERSTALHIATKQGEVEMVLMLLAAGANRYIADEEGRTPLSIAMEAEQEHLQELVTSESPPSIQYLAMYSSPYALLHTILLADSPRIDVVDMILRKDPVAERFGYAAAGDEDSFSITTHLFGGVATSAAALDTTTDFTSTAIEALVREVVMPRESLALVLQSLLLQDPAAGSTAPIYQCTRHHDYASVRALLLQAVDVNVVCPTKGYSPLIAAVYNRDVKMIQLLLHTGRGGMTALHYAAQLGLTTVVGLLLARGAQRGIANLQQHTAVDVAVANGHMDTANVLRFDPHKISLCLAAKHGDWLVMKALLLQGISINVVKEHVHPQKGRHYELDTPLIAAVSHGQYELVKKLLTELPTYAAGSSSGSGPVADTAADDDMMIFPQVLDVNQVNTIGQSALMYAAARGEENIVLLLLKHGADRYVKDTAGHDAVHWAMAQNHSQLATILRHDPDLIYVHDLIRKNDFEAVVAMFKQGVDVNLRRERLLVNLSHPTVVAAREEALPVPPVVPASASHAAGASAAAAATGTTGAAGPSSSSLSSTASSIASTATSSLFTYHHGRRLSAPTVARLEALQEFARMFIPGETPLIVAARYARMDVLQLLFKAPNVDIDAIEDTNGWSALFYAAEQGQEEVVKFLLAKKANRKLEDCLGRCARDIALLHHHEVIAAMIDADPYHVHIHDTCQHGLLMLTIGLLKQGCPPTFRDERPGMHRQTPLMAAASGGQVDIMRMLLRYPAVYDGKDDRDALGRTALMRAAAVGALDATAVLLNAGCDRSLQDQQGLTARDHAARHSFSVMFQFMSQSMVR
eukprot:gene11374-8092_t